MSCSMIQRLLVGVIALSLATGCSQENNSQEKRDKKAKAELSQALKESKKKNKNLEEANEAFEEANAELRRANQQLSDERDRVEALAEKAGNELNLAAQERERNAQTLKDERAANDKLLAEGQTANADEAQRLANLAEQRDLEYKETKRELEGLRNAAEEAQKANEKLIDENKAKLAQISKAQKALEEDIEKNQGLVEDQAQLIAQKQDLVDEQKRLEKANTEAQAKIEKDTLALKQAEEEWRARLVEIRETIQNEERESMGRIQSEEQASLQRIAKEEADSKKRIEEATEEAKGQIANALKIAQDKILNNTMRRLFDMKAKDPEAAVPLLVMFESGQSFRNAAKQAISDVRKNIRAINQNPAYRQTWKATEDGKVTNKADDVFLIQAKPEDVIALRRKVMTDTNKMTVTVDGEQVEADISDFVMKLVIVDTIRISPKLYLYDGNGDWVGFDLHLQSVELEDILAKDLNFLAPQSYIFGQQGARSCATMGADCVSFLNSQDAFDVEVEIEARLLPDGLKKAMKRPDASTTTRVGTAKQVLQSFAQSTVALHQQVLEGKVSSPNQGLRVADPRKSLKSSVVVNFDRDEVKDSLSGMALGFTLDFIDTTKEGQKDSLTARIPLLGRQEGSGVELLIMSDIVAGANNYVNYYNKVLEAL